MVFKKLRPIIYVCVVMWPALALTAETSRLALVIGNADYEHAVFPSLSNPIYDARDVARVLEAFCFEVILEENADRDSMLAAIEEFGRRLSEQGGLGLFYYSGHGLQFQQQQYLIPLRSALFDEEELPTKGIHADTIVRQMALAGNAHNILIFDSCREPFTPEHSGSAGKDFVAMQGPPGSVIVFSSSLGQSAFGDSGARNSLYTRHLVQALQEDRGQDFLDILRVVNRSVTEEATFYRLNAQSLQLLQQKGLPEELLHWLQHPQLFQADFTQQQFEQALQELLSSEQYEQYIQLIRSSAEHSQAPWLYTNITDKIVLSESCPSAPGSRPPLRVDILSVPETDEIVLSPEPTPLEFMALLSFDADDARYAWSLNSAFGRLEGDPASSRIRYIPPPEIEADMTGVSIVLTVRRGEETIRQEKRLTLLAAAQSSVNAPLQTERVTTPSASKTWKWIAGVGGLAAASVATAAIVNNAGNTATERPSSVSFFSYTGLPFPGTYSFSVSGDAVSRAEISSMHTNLTFVSGKLENIYGERSVNINIQLKDRDESCFLGSAFRAFSGYKTDTEITLEWEPIRLSGQCGGDSVYTYTENEGRASYRLLDGGGLSGESGQDSGMQFNQG